MQLQLYRKLFLRLFRWLRKSLYLLWVELHQQLLFCVQWRMLRLYGVRLDLRRWMLLRLHGGLRRKLLRELRRNLYRVQRRVRLDL